VKKQRNGIKKDRLIVALVNSKVFTLILLVVLLLFLFQDDRILNTGTKKISALVWAVGLGIFLLFMSFRVWKYSTYYKSLFSDFVSVVASLIFTAFYTFFIVTFIQIPVLMYIRGTALNSPKQNYDCEVVNVITLGVDKVYFEFKGKRFTRYIDLNGISDEDAENLCRLRVTVRKAYFDCYILDAFELVPKIGTDTLTERHGTRFSRPSIARSI
jgi:hypothetical protein